MILRILIVLMAIAGVAGADAPKGYKCGPGGYRVKDSCKCPQEKRPARDADDKAICEPKPEPAPTACLADRKGKYPIKIESTPLGATIYLGDKKCGAVATTPWSGKLAAGPVIVIVEHQSYEPDTRTVTIKPKAIPTLSFSLQRTNAGFVEVRADADANVTGISVTIDGQDKGAVPVKIKVPIGRHLVEIAKPGFDNYQQWIEVLDGQTQLLLPVLRPIVAAKVRLVIDADVKQAEVFVNGERKGTTPLALDGLAVGTYTILVKSPGAKDWQQKVTLSGGSTLVRAELAASIPKLPTEAELDITADVKGAEVWIDGAQVGKAPLLHRVTGGDHWIEVKLAGHVTWEVKRAFDAGTTAKLRATLTPAGILEVTSTPAGATVFIGGVRRGLTPYRAELPRGDHIVIVERAGYQRFEQRVKLTDKPTAVDAKLKR